MSEKKRRVLSAVLICLCIATAAFIWGNSMLGSKASSNVSNSVLGALDPIIRRFGIVSKSDLWLGSLAHFARFAAPGRGAAVPCCGEWKARISVRVKLCLCCAARRAH